MTYELGKRLKLAGLFYIHDEYTIWKGSLYKLRDLAVLLNIPMAELRPRQKKVYLSGEYTNTQGAAFLLNTSQSALKLQRRQGTGPPYVKIGFYVLYSLLRLAMHKEEKAEAKVRAAKLRIHKPHDYDVVKRRDHGMTDELVKRLETAGLFYINGEYTNATGAHFIDSNIGTFPGTRFVFCGNTVLFDLQCIEGIPIDVIYRRLKARNGFYLKGEYTNTEGAAYLIGVTAPTLLEWRSKHSGPPSVKVNGCGYLFPLATLEEQRPKGARVLQNAWTRELAQKRLKAGAP